MKHTGINLKNRRLQSVQGQQGFTLLELMVVIAVAAILMAIAVPSFERMVLGSSSNRASLELVSYLNEARMKAIRTHRNVTVAFNQPGQDQYTMTWDDNGEDRTKVGALGAHGVRVGFDDNPPGGSPDPDDSFIFNALGFIQTDLGSPTGNIYLVDNVNGKYWNIATTVAGDIVERSWNGSAWSGPELSYTP
jgi:type IV fimbrial biogenesis protein FimT